MTSDEGWSQPEIVRALTRIEENGKRLEEKLDAWTLHFVSKELHDQQLKAVEDRHVELTKWITDIAADGERSQKDRARIRDEMLTKSAAWKVVGLVVSLMTIAATLSTTVAIH